jgi:hypothetical protein
MCGSRRDKGSSRPPICDRRNGANLRHQLNGVMVELRAIEPQLRNIRFEGPFGYRAAITREQIGGADGLSQLLVSNFRLENIDIGQKTHFSHPYAMERA